MTKLYELTSDYLHIQNMDPDEVSQEAIDDALEAIGEDINTKLDNIAWLIEDNKAKALIYKEKKEAFAKAQKSLENQNKWLMEYMTSTIDALGMKKVETDNHILSPRNFKAGVEVDETKLASIYFKEKVERKPDKAVLYDLLKKGEVIEGASLKPNRKTVIK